MTEVYFVRHAQPDHGCSADDIRPLTAAGIADTRFICDFFAEKKPAYIISSPYKRSLDTLKSTAEYHGMSINADSRLREREKGVNGQNNVELFKKRWADLDYTDDGETIAEVMKRNIEALGDILKSHSGKIVVGTHGTALCSILNYYDRGIGFDFFVEKIDMMPWIELVRFEDTVYLGHETVLAVHKGFR